VLLPRVEVVRFAVELKDNARGVTDEIHDVRANRRLPAERLSVKVFRFQIAPQQSLRACHLASQRLCPLTLSKRDC
jgi:hypothetical protein